MPENETPPEEIRLDLTTDAAGSAVMTCSRLADLVEMARAIQKHRCMETHHAQELADLAEFMMIQRNECLFYMQEMVDFNHIEEMEIPKTLEFIDRISAND